MKMQQWAIALVVGSGLAVSAASADLLEFLITVGGDGDGAVGSAHAVVVFDTDAPPILSDEDGDTFAGLGGWMEGVVAGAAFDGVSDDLSPTFARGPLTLATFRYNEPFDTYEIRLATGDANMGVSVRAPGGFDSGLLSLPDSIDEYRPTFPDGAIFTGFSIVGGGGVAGQFFVLLASGQGGTGLNLRFVDEIPGYACNPADIDRNGMLNFDDIDAFVSGFLGGCP